VNGEAGVRDRSERDITRQTEYRQAGAIPYLARRR
jgi:hypothetical protein